MLVSVVVTALVAAAIGVDLAARRSAATRERVALILLGYAPFLASAFVAGGVLEGTASIMPLAAAAATGAGHTLAQCGSPRSALLLESLAIICVAVSAVLFIEDEPIARAVLVLDAVALLEVAIVAPSDLRKL